MRSRYTIVDSEGIYFLTATVVEWLPVFIGRDPAQIVLDSLTYCRSSKGLRLYAYVIMENHLHLVAEAPELSRVMQSFKRHTAAELLNWARATRKTWLLNQFEYFKKKYKAASDHQVWQEGSHPQLIEGDAVLQQKVDYVHDNPVRRGYVDAPEHWRLSSARNYLLVERPAMEIDLLPV